METKMLLNFHLKHHLFSTLVSQYKGRPTTISAERHLGQEYDESSFKLSKVDDFFAANK